MKYELKDKDYLKLYLYYQDRAIDVKGAMFKTVTWIIGFAAALLGFCFAKLASYDSCKAAISLPMLMRLISGAGIVICLYAGIAIKEAAKHIKRNWEHSDQCLEEIKGLKSIIGIKKKVEAKNLKKRMAGLIPIWIQMYIVVFLFLIAFIGILIWSFKCRTCFQ